MNVIEFNHWSQARSELIWVKRELTIINFNECLLVKTDPGFYRFEYKTKTKHCNVKHILTISPYFRRIHHYVDFESNNLRHQFVALGSKHSIVLEIFQILINNIKNILGLIDFHKECFIEDFKNPSRYI